MSRKEVIKEAYRDLGLPRTAAIVPLALLANLLEDLLGAIDRLGNRLATR